MVRDFRRRVGHRSGIRRNRGCKSDRRAARSWLQRNLCIGMRLAAPRQRFFGDRMVGAIALRSRQSQSTELPVSNTGWPDSAEMALIIEAGNYRLRLMGNRAQALYDSIRLYKSSSRT